MRAIDACDQMYKDIEKMITEKMKHIRYDKSFRATVTKKVNNDIYKVSHKNVEYRVKSYYDLVVGDLVWVCVPSGNWDSLFVQSCDTVGKKIGSLNNYDFRADGIYLNGRKITN
ncbi:hypothetical protein SAMN05443270_0423 [Lacrimispora sphenoides]|jgi:hypothetical protein|uniref:hypothetical protein n=1 Tax=Lacrimispora sphenoides TaxID=29370 RepID=UPI0008BD8CF4|nr:hypothetical protein [Lacrimispora sphenoides]SET54113.1 hypothetical protein SAMN05443270_0423 [Lacrimispora sphenoides]